MHAELNLLWAGLAAYVLSGSLAIAGVVFGRRPERAVLALLALGLALHGAAIGLRWERLGHGPFVTLFEILLSNVWSLLFVFALAYGCLPVIRASAAVVMPILFVMMGWLLVTNPGEGHYPATYHTPWLYVHVAMGKVFLGAVLVAVGLAGVILLRRAGLPRLAFPRMPGDARLDDLAWRFMALAFIFESLMLVAGAIWAQDAWGRYWDWDPLETWSFLTWLLLAFALHLRVSRRVAPSLGAALVLGVFTLAFLTFFGVPFVSTAAHQGAV